MGHGLLLVLIVVYHGRVSSRPNIESVMRHSIMFSNIIMAIGGETVGRGSHRRPQQAPKAGQERATANKGFES